MRCDTGAEKIVNDWYATSDFTLLAEDVRWRVLDRWPAGGIYVGRSAVEEQFFPRVRGLFSEYGVAVDQIFAVDDSLVLAFGAHQGRVMRSGDLFVARSAHIWTARGGPITSFEQIAGTAVVQEALRRSESRLEV